MWRIGKRQEGIEAVGDTPIVPHRICQSMLANMFEVIIIEEALPK